jgi:hypothetical protein
VQSLRDGDLLEHHQRVVVHTVAHVRRRHLRAGAGYRQQRPGV